MMNKIKKQIKIYLDTSSYINILKEENKQLHDLLIKKINDKEIILLFSHGIHDDGLWSDISHLPKELVFTGCFVCSYSRLGMARLGDPTGAYTKLVEDIPDKSKNRNSVWDAIHYATAWFEEVDFFVSDDGKLSRKVRQKLNEPIKILTLEEFGNLLLNNPPSKKEGNYMPKST